MIYLTSDIDAAYQFACIDRPVFDGEDWEASVYEIKIKIPARNIFDVRQSAEDPRVERLAKTLGLYAGGVGDLHYENFDVGLGYSGGKHRAEAIDLGFGGWLETETPYLHYGKTTPCSIGLFTDLQRDAYEIVHEWRFGVDECVRVELSAEP